MQILEGKCKIILFTFQGNLLYYQNHPLYYIEIHIHRTFFSKFNHNPTVLREYYTDYSHLPPRLSENPVVQHVEAHK